MKEDLLAIMADTIILKMLLYLTGVFIVKHDMVQIMHSEQKRRWGI
jgi:hypothetical protein